MLNLLLRLYILLTLLSVLNSHPVVQDLDISRFMGKWYVIALIPNWVEGDGENSYDEYKLNEDGTIDITYYSRKDGKEKSIKQKGFVDVNETGRWEVQFLKPYIPFYSAPYELIILDSDYRYMVVGYPNNTYGWIMGRSTSIDDEIFNGIINRLELEFGYKKDDFRKVKHDTIE